MSIDPNLSKIRNNEHDDKIQFGAATKRTKTMIQNPYPKSIQNPKSDMSISENPKSKIQTFGVSTRLKFVQNRVTFVAKNRGSISKIGARFPEKFVALCHFFHVSLQNIHHLFLEEGSAADRRSQVPKLFQQWLFYASIFQQYGSSLGIRKIFCKSSALRKCTWACKSRWKDALHILRLQVQHTKTNKSCQWTKHWQKKPSEAGDYGR